MKLKRLFWDKRIVFTTGLLLLVISAISCSSSKFEIPIPGKNDTVISNIYIEYMNIADTYFDLKKYDKAETYYIAAMKNKDIYWNACYKLAKCYVFEAKWNEAQSCYETLLKRDPENITIQSSLAYIYAMNGNTQKAIEEYSKLIEKSSEQSELLENYICVLLAAEKKEEALEQYTFLKEKFPESKRLEELGKHFETTENKQAED